MIDKNNNNFLCAKDVYKKYGTPERIPPVLSGVSLTIEKGEIVAILGASGAGKSTLLYILGMMPDPCSSKAHFDVCP